MDIDISGDILRHILGKWHTLWFATYYQDISIPNSGELGLHLTSSTAQGGGGSFKNRKPIGEIGCCESGMAERSH